MHPRTLLILTTSLVLSVPLLGCSTMAPPAARSVATAPPPARKPREARHVYQLDFVLSSGEADKTASSTTYTLNLEEENSGEIHQGTNIALSPQARMDVGLKLRGNFTTVGDDLLLHSNLEMSAVDEATTIRKVAASGDTLVSPGKQALVTSVEDPVGHKRYQLMVTATKLR